MEEDIGVRGGGGTDEGGLQPHIIVQIAIFSGKNHVIFRQNHSDFRASNG